MNIFEIQQLNLERAQEWHEGSEPWTGGDWAAAMCGEFGEAANVVKKIRRIETGVRNAVSQNKNKGIEDLRVDLESELAGGFLYMLLLASHYHIDMEKAIEDEFDRKSTENGFTKFIGFTPEVNDAAGT
jgi:NTP pyrophosphatase (non-canonical NTP hydrolase)